MAQLTGLFQRGGSFYIRILLPKDHRSGFYAWLHEPLSPRAKANKVLTAKIKEFYDQSMGIYGSPRIFCDLCEAGVACGENRVARLMRAAQIKSVRRYKRPRYKVGTSNKTGKLVADWPTDSDWCYA